MAEHRDFVGHASADDQYIETPPGAGYEHTDASVWAIVKFGIWLAIAAILVHIGLAVFFAGLVERSKETAAPQYPLASATPELPPEPRLQQFPQVDMYKFRLAENQQLHTYGWVSRRAGTVHIPIDVAKELLVTRGLPSRAPGASGSMQAADVFASDASSGRVMERRRE